MCEAYGRPVPWPVFYVSGPECEGLAGSLGTEHYIENPVVISQATGPRAFSVFVLTIAERLRVAGSQNVIDVIDNLPVNEIGGLHDRNARIHVHRGTGHVVGISDSDDTRIRNVSPDNRVLSGLSISHCPRSLPTSRQQDQNRPYDLPPHPHRLFS